MRKPIISTKGEHTVETSALATGDASKAVVGGDFQFSVAYAVIVR